MAQIIHTQSTTFGDNNSNCNNTIGSNNTTTTFYNSDEDARIMHWLSPLDPDNRHHSLRTHRFEGIGDWLLETSEFREWRGSKGGADQAVLFCSGDPGVGKTHLSSLVIDRLCDQASEEDLAIAWMYCDYNIQQDQTVTNIMGAIVKQLVGRGGIPKDIQEAFQAAKKVGGRRPLLINLMRMLRALIVSLPRVFIFIDALDEFLPKDLPILLKSLRDISQESPGTRIYLTARPHVGGAIQTHFAKAVTIPVRPDENDIRDYVVMRLDNDEVPEAMDNRLRAEIVRIIVDKMSNIFLLASLNMEAILGEVTIGQRRKKLEEMERGNGLSDAYTATLTRLQAQKGNMSILGLKALMWVSYSERPLSSAELCHALGVEIGSTELNPENVPGLRILLSSCLGLLTVEASSSTLRLVHFSLQEHLSSDPALFHRPHSTIAEVCLTYLNFGSVMELSPTGDWASSTMTLLQYASVYWGDHARRGMTGNAEILALRLLDRFDEHVSAQLLLLSYMQYRFRGPCFYGGRGPVGFTGLHGVAYLGIVELVAAVLEVKKWDVNAMDCTGSTALIWAAYRGWSDVVNLLLEREDVNSDLGDGLGRAPLAWAAQGGHESVVRILMQREDVNPDQPCTGSGRTPLSYAAEGGHEGVVKILFERKGVDPHHVSTTDGRTPLSWAAGGGHEGVVQMLLELEGVNPEHADRHEGWTPLSWAAWYGHPGVVKILLQRKDVNPNHVGRRGGRMPLSLASEGGHEGVVKMLLERQDVNPDQADTQYGQTPLYYAAEGGHDGVVKTLLERPDVNPDKGNKYCWTPLAGAAGFGHEGVVKTLLEREEVNPDQRDTYFGLTPLSRAAKDGYEGVVKILLARKEVNPNNVDTEWGQTPLARAAEGGHEGVVETLLERSDVNPNQPDTYYGQTPLAWAAREGHEGVVKILLKRKDVNPDHVNTKYGQTPLSSAAARGYEGIVKVLLQRRDVDPDHVDTEYGQTPLTRAARYGHEGVVEMLLERKDVDPGHVDTEYGRTPLSWAAKGGYEGVVKVLLESWDVNLDQADKSGRTPLLLAAEGGHEGVVKILLERKDINPGHEGTEYGLTPLLLAAQGGHEVVVKMLLGLKHVNPDQADTEYGRTPLSWAAGGGYQGVVKMLLERKEVNPDRADTEYGRTPLSWAAESGHEEVVKMFLERKDVDPDQADTFYGRTPLSWAAGGCHEGVVKMFLERKDVNPDRADSEYGRTPLSWAAEGSHECKAERPPPPPEDLMYLDMVHAAWISRYWGVVSRHESVVKVLLAREDVNPDQADSKYGRTPLSWAAEGGYERVVKMFLERKDVNPNQADTEYGLTPLSWAAKGGHETVVKMFLELKNVRTAMPDDQNQAPPLASPPKERNGPISVLLDPGHPYFHSAGSSGQSSLPRPTELQDEFLVETQFSSHDPNADITDFSSQPSLPPTDSVELEQVPELNDWVSKSLDCLPSAQPPLNPPAASPLPLKFLLSLRKSCTQPNNTRPTLTIVLNRYWVIFSYLYLIALLTYHKNSRNQTSRKNFGVASAAKLRYFFVFSLLKLGLRNLRRQDTHRFRCK